MTLKFSITKEDFVEFNRRVFSQNKQVRRTLMILRFFGPVLFFFFWLFTKDKESTYMFTTIFLSVVSIIWIIFLPKFTMRQSLKKVAKQADDPKNRNFFDEREMTFDEKGMKITTNDVDTNVAWNYIVSADENDKYFFVFISEVQAYVIPKRVMNEQEQTELKVILIQNVRPVVNTKTSKK